MQSVKPIVAGTLAAAACLACDKNPVEQNSDPQLTLSPDSVVVGAAESSPLIATVRDASGAIQYVSLQYVSRDQSVATVNANGAISAVAVGSTHVVAALPDRPDVRDSVRVRVHADSCSGARPDFGGVATAADRNLFGYDVNAPLNLQKAVESTNNGVEVSAISRSITQDRAEQIQLIKDLQRAVDVLRARPNADAARIAYVGVSYGGAVGALFVGIERRLRAAALVVGDGGLVSHFTGPEDLNFMAGLSCATRLDWFRAMAPIEPIRFLAHASPTPLLLQNGRAHNLVPVADAEALHAAAPEPKTIRWYAAGHGLNQQALFDRHDWLHEQIGLDARQ